MSKYKTMLIDADTALFTAAKSVQTDYILAKHKTNGFVKRFKNRSELWGEWRKREGGWLAKRNLDNPNDLWTSDDFDVEECAEYSTEIRDHLEHALMNFNGFVGKMKRLGISEDYILFFGGEGNFRYAAAQQHPYKSSRNGKPLVYHELKMKIVQQYGKRVILTDNAEAEDGVSWYAWKSYLNYRKTGVWRDVVGRVDKDLDQLICPTINYHDREPKVFIPDELYCARRLCEQMLSGDFSVDSIVGLPNLTPEIREKYELSKTKGVGTATASRLLRTCKTPKELYERVVEAYKSYYGVEKKEFVTFRGDKLMWNYLDYLNDNAVLLYMQRYEGEVFNIRERLTLMGIEYEDDSSEK